MPFRDAEERARWECDHDIDGCLCQWSAERLTVANQKPAGMKQMWADQHRSHARQLLAKDEPHSALWHVEQAARLDLQEYRRRQSPQVPIGPPEMSGEICNPDKGGCGLDIRHRDCRCADERLADALTGEALGLVEWKDGAWV